MKLFFSFGELRFKEQKMTRLPEFCGSVAHALGKVAKDLPGHKLGQILCTYLHYSFPAKQLRSKNREFDINLLVAAFFFFLNHLLFSVPIFFYLLVFMPRSFLNDRLFLLRILVRRGLSLPHAKYDISVSLQCVSSYFFCTSMGFPLPPLLIFQSHQG